MATFSQLKSSYPKSDRATFYTSLGGGWPQLIDNPNYQNTCATRMSVTLLASELAIPAYFGQALAGDGRRLIINVKRMDEFLKATFGGESWGITKPAGKPATLPNQTGIVLYQANYSDATGHVDLWTGTAFVGRLDVWQGIELPADASMADVDAAFDIALWYIG